MTKVGFQLISSKNIKRYICGCIMPSKTVNSIKKFFWNVCKWEDPPTPKDYQAKNFWNEGGEL